MISLDDITKIQMLKVDGFSIRHVAKETHLHRLTVKKYWNWNRGGCKDSCGLTPSLVNIRCKPVAEEYGHFSHGRAPGC